MKLDLNLEILKTPIEAMIKNALKEAKDIKSKIYLSLAYFQYINKLSTNKAIRLFKEYILSDGQKLGYPFSVYYTKDGKLITKYVEIPLKVDEFLSQFIPEISNHKDLVSKITKSRYIRFVKKHLNMNASDITAYTLYSMVKDIGIHNLISLREHWTLFTRRLLPYLIKNNLA
ncbi:MAG: hypothetical protein NV1_14 [Nanoarchaeotal virus 1]|nr:MAG: hypothetical protein NV1_14 [Nanoarchaeotal virus 1]